MTPADAARLQAVYRRETASVVQYARNAQPYTPPADRPLAIALGSLTAGHDGLLTAFQQWFTEHGVEVPAPGSFPMRFTDFNDIAVRALVRRVVAERKRELAALDADEQALSDPDARAAVGVLGELSRKTLAELEAAAG